MKKLILSTVLLMSLNTLNILCDMDVNNQTGDIVYVTVEGVTKKILPGGKEIFTVSLKEGKTLDGIPFGRRDTMAKWVRIVGGVFPIVYRTKGSIPAPKSLFLLPEGGSYLYWWWWGLEGAGIPKEEKGRVAEEITDKYDNQMRIFREKLNEGLSAYKEKSYADKLKNLRSQLDSLYQDFAKTEVK